MLTPGIFLITMTLGTGTSSMCKKDKDGMCVLILMIKNEP